MKEEKLSFGKFELEEIKVDDLKEITGGGCFINNHGGGNCGFGNYADEDKHCDDGCFIGNHQA